MTIRFYSINDAYGCFSNFSPHPIQIGRVWPTSEHYFQAQKFSDLALHDKICRDPSPMRAAQIGRSRKHPLRPDWEDIKLDVMRTALLAKFTQHNDLRTILLETKGQDLVEHTPHDHFWADGGDGSGKNMLGSLLMELRAVLAPDGSLQGPFSGYEEIKLAETD
ncbi:NADAR family protein [Stappia sp. BW2]|uniref:NADAR family protein n=1 Tax=Stappia sp. BW2 TaxID=2592622 RepID=UPI0011DEDFD9|nr:NADAR family protein [Stappia sp. BW2]TYC72480.1 NADAR family protein [Stappia sp. BW2]